MFRSLVTAFALFVLAAPANAAAPREAMLVSTQWLADHLSDPDLVVLHVGTPDSYTRHIPGARLVRTADIAVTSDAATLEMLPPEELRGRLASLNIGDTSRIVVYYTEPVAQATRVIFTLDAAGLGARTSMLDGGFAAWQREGRTLSQDVPAPQVAALSPLKMKAGVIVNADFVRANAGKPNMTVIDARLPEFYSGAKPGGVNNRAHKPGHIPGALNVPVTTLTDANMNVQSAAGLRAAFDKAGVKPSDKLVVYCHIGQQATAIIFAARSLGYDAVLYDGSFEDWSARDLPVEKSAP